MCGSIRDSVLAGSIIYGTAAAFVLTRKPEFIWLGSTLFVIGTIQLLDAAIWFFESSAIARYGILSVLMLEPFIAYMGYVYYYKNRLPLYELAYALFAIISIYTWIIECEDTTITKDGYLKWCDYDMTPLAKWSFMLLLLFPFLYFPDINHKILLLTTTLAAWAYNYNHEAFGSRWCYSTVIYCILASSLLVFHKR